MKILYISHSAALYGAPKSLLEYVIKLKEKGVEPIVVMPCKGELQAELDKNKIKNQIIPYYNRVYEDTYRFSDYIRYVWTNLKAVLKIRKLIKTKQVSIVHTNTLAVNVGAIAAYTMRVPHIWHFREYLKEDFGYKQLDSRITKKLVKSSKCCIAVSEGIKKKYRKEYDIDIVRLYNGIERSLYEYPIKKAHTLSEMGTLLLAGAICEGKGQWDAVRAVEILVDREVYVHLNIVGNGEYSFVNELKKYIKSKGLKEYISILPYTHNLQELRVQSSIILMCSRMEAFGRVTAEAMMAGKIVIGTNSGGTVELIGQNEERGYLYQYGHPEELADKIYYVLMSEKEVLEKERKAQKFIIASTDMDRYTDRILKIYKKVAVK